MPTKTKTYKHLSIEPRADSHAPTATIYEVYNRTTRAFLARIIYFKPWAEWILEPNNMTQPIFSASCLRDIVEFLERGDLD
jgi:hypothetical protein